MTKEQIACRRFVLICLYKEQFTILIAKQLYWYFISFVFGGNPIGYEGNNLLQLYSSAFLISFAENRRSEAIPKLLYCFDQYVPQTCHIGSTRDTHTVLIVYRCIYI